MGALCSDENLRIEKIIFWDHVIGSKKPALCSVIGEVFEESELIIVVRYWACLEEEGGEENSEFLTVLKSTVVARLVSDTWLARPIENNP
jgi:hypothetical protein